MPVTVRLLERLQEALGNEATVDLVALLNEATGSSRDAMRETAELYYGRFDARLEQRLAETRAELRTELANQRAELIKWMFIFWVGTIVPLAGLILTLNRR